MRGCGTKTDGKAIEINRDIKKGGGWASAGVTMQKKCQVGFDKWDVLPKNVQLGSEMDTRIKIYLGLEDFSKINGVSR